MFSIKDQLLLKDGEPIYLKGFNLTCKYWEESELILNLYQTNDAYIEMKQMGANAVRILFSYKIFESDIQPFKYNEAAFQWLNLQIRFASEQGLGIVLCMILPVGADWNDVKPKLDFSLWHDPIKQERFIALWCEIANRYFENDAIIAFDLFNAPVTDDGTGELYELLASRTIKALRQIDKKRVLIMGKLYGVNGKQPFLCDHDRFIKFDDELLIYDMHFYEPFLYTHQYAEWVGVSSDGGKYPDVDRDKKFLLSNFKQVFDFREKHNVPVLVSEIGLINHCFKTEKGGLIYISDLVEILEVNGLGFFYWDFQSEVMGVYKSEAEQELIKSDLNFELSSKLFNKL